MILLGWNTINLKQFRVEDLYCPICKTKGSLVFYLIGRVYHLFLIPFFPDNRYVYAHCEHCGESIKKVDLEKTHRKLFDVRQYSERTSILSWIGLFILILTIMYFVFK